MVWKGWFSLIALALAGCGGESARRDADAPAGLEAAAVERGLVRDSGDMALTGLFARETDRLCLVEQNGGARVGIVSDLGEGHVCAASGVVTRSGKQLIVELGAAGDCRFNVAYDGQRIVFPGSVPDGCRRFCTRRASLAGISVTRQSESIAEASALRDNRGRSLCGA